jgi:hypothetical protein
MILMLCGLRENKANAGAGLPVARGRMLPNAIRRGWGHSPSGLVADCFVALQRHGERALERPRACPVVLGRGRL